MRELTIAEAQTQLSALVDAVERGEDVVLTRDGRPVARLVQAPRFTPRAHLRTPEERAAIEATAARLAELQKRTSPTSFDWKEFVEDGRE